MITVKYNRKRHLVSVKGHAKSGEVGHDLVCAATSVLVYTLAANVANAKQNGCAKDIKINLESGEASIRCKAFSDYNEQITMIFSAVCVGFELLARDYPDNIEYIIK